MNSITVNFVDDSILTKSGVYYAGLMTRRILANTGLRVSTNATGEFDVLHSNTNTPYFLYKYVRSTHKRCLIHVHVVPETFLGTLVLAPLWLPLFRVYLRWVLERADLLVAVSPLVKEHLVRMGVQTNTVVIPNAVDRSRFRRAPLIRAQMRQRLGIDDTQLVVLGAGHVEPRKGIHTFLEVARAMPELVFVWVGGIALGPLTAGYREMSRMMAHGPRNLIFTGLVPFEQMTSYYNLGDLFFLPSYQELFPLVVLEAAACGLPLVLRDLPSYTPIFGRAYFRAKHNEEFIWLLRRLQRDALLQQEYRQRASHLAERYGVENVSPKWLRLYEGLVQ